MHKSHPAVSIFPGPLTSRCAGACANLTAVLKIFFIFSTGKFAPRFECDRFARDRSSICAPLRSLPHQLPFQNNDVWAQTPVVFARYRPPLQSAEFLTRVLALAAMWPSNCSLGGLYGHSRLPSEKTGSRYRPSSRNDFVFNVLRLSRFMIEGKLRFARADIKNSVLRKSGV